MEEAIKKLLSSQSDKILNSLNTFNETTKSIFKFPEVPETLTSQIWLFMYKTISTSDDHQIQAQGFSAIRILSREKSLLNNVISDDWITLIRKCCGLPEDGQFLQLNEKTAMVAIEAEKCLSNIFFNHFPSAKKCCNNGFLKSIFQRITTYHSVNYSNELHFMDMKLVFLLSALCPHIRKKLQDDFQSNKHLIEYLELSLKESTKETGHSNFSEVQVETLSELLKALFNTTIHAQASTEEELTEHRRLVAILRQLLMVSIENLEKTWALRNNVVNLLTNMPEESFDALYLPIEEGQIVSKHLQFEGFNMCGVYEILVLLEAKFNDQITVSNQNITLAPTMTVLLKGANANRAIRKYLKNCILPPLKDVHTRPEEGTTIRNCLCRLLTSPITQLRDITAEFLFILCKKNVRRMIKYTGYGNASGLFAQKGLLGGRKDAGEANFSSDSDSETEEYAEHKHGINPILGCYEEPRPDPMANMTEEQKEYEAMELVKLMDSLTKCGTVKPCRIGKDGRPEPIEHVLELQNCLKAQRVANNDSDESD